MNLSDLRQRPYATFVLHRAYCLQKQLAIALDVGVGILGRQSEVQCLAAVTGGDAALPGAESMHQPGNAAECLRTEDFDHRSG